MKGVFEDCKKIIINNSKLNAKIFFIIIPFSIPFKIVLRRTYFDLYYFIIKSIQNQLPSNFFGDLTFFILSFCA